MVFWSAAAKSSFDTWEVHRGLVFCPPVTATETDLSFFRADERPAGTMALVSDGDAQL